MNDFLHQAANYLTILTVATLAVAAFLLRRQIKGNAKVDAENQSVIDNLARLQIENHAIANEGKGKVGELAVEKRITEIMESMKMGFKTNRMYGLPDAIVKPSGSDPFSKEYDLILVCELGVYVFEIKTWHGLWERNPEDRFKLQSVRDEKIDHRDDPLHKTQKKLELITKRIPGNIKRTSLVVFADPNSKVGYDLSADYLHIDDLSFFFRRERDHIRETPDFMLLDAMDAVFGTLDHSPTARHDHMMRLSPATENVKAYQNNHRTAELLKKRPKLGYQDNTACRMSAFVFAGFLVFTIAFRAFIP